MNSIPFIQNLYENAKKKNVVAGIIIFGIIAFIAYLISAGLSLFFYGDIQFLFGAIVGIIFSLKNVKKGQSALRNGLIVGIFGACLSATSIGMFEWAYYSIQNGFQILHLLFLLIDFGLPSLIIGIIVGLIAGYYYLKKQTRKENLIDDEFFNGLIED